MIGIFITMDIDQASVKEMKTNRFCVLNDDDDQQISNYLLHFQVIYDHNKMLLQNLWLVVTQ